MSIGENYEGSISPTCSDISRFSGGTEAEALRRRTCSNPTRSSSAASAAWTATFKRANRKLGNWRQCPADISCRI